MGNNITLFTIPRGFQGIHKVRQENTLNSWIRLKPCPEIILFCDEAGIKGAAKQYKCRYEPKVERNQWGTPLISGVFHRAQEVAQNDILCYSNADIIMMQDIMAAIDIVSKKFDQFLIVGQRWDLQIGDPLWGFPVGWQDRLQNIVRQQGKLHRATGLDYFVFKRGLYKKVPPFAVGRWAWDNWLIYHALKQQIPTVDATEAVMVVHQGFSAKQTGNEEWKVNQQLYRKNSTAKHVVGDTTQTTWRLTKTGELIRR